MTTFPPSQANIICIYSRAPFQPVPPCHGTGYFFSLEVSKVSKVSYLSRFHNQKVSKWHWLIFSPFGALAYSTLYFFLQKTLKPVGFGTIFITSKEGIIFSFKFNEKAPTQTTCNLYFTNIDYFAFVSTNLYRFSISNYCLLFIVGDLKVK